MTTKKILVCSIRYDSSNYQHMPLNFWLCFYSESPELIYTYVVIHFHTYSNLQKSLNPTEAKKL